MLASITPLGERGRQSRWPLTTAAFLLGAAGAGTLAGAALGLMGSWMIGGLEPRARLALLVAAAAVALTLDVVPARIPGPRRQVNESWRNEFRGWVWGGGYGVQLGVGLATVVRSAATYLALSAAFLVASADPGALIVGLFGLLRGVQPLTTWWVRSPQELVRFHAGLARWQQRARLVGCATLTAILALAVASVLV